MYRDLAKRYGWPAQVVAEMTPAQQLMYYEEDGSQDKTLHFGSLNEANEWRQRHGEC